MKIGNIILNSALLLTIAAGGVYLYNPNLLESWWQQAQARIGAGRPIPGSFIGNNIKGIEWAEPETVQSKVEEAIMKNLSSTAPAVVKAFLKDPKNRLLLAQWMIAQNETSSTDLLKKSEEELTKRIERIKGEIAEIEADKPDGVEPTTRLGVQLKNKKEELGKLEAEALQSHAILESISAPGAGKLMEQITNNLDWAEQFAWSGDAPRVGTALAILADVVAKEPEIIYNQMERDIATAAALEFAKSGWQHNEALDRVDFYPKNWRAGRLNKVFDTLPFWQRRTVVGCKGDNNFGSPESMQWSLDNVHLPAEQYSGCCWRCGYKLYNLYGQSIHGPGYNQPFDDYYARNRAQFTYEVGGVCGSLSHFGAFAALANGIPALTMGEPAHCAFVVRVGDKWVPSYSVDWKRGLHWTPWPDNNRYTTLDLASKLFSDEEAENTLLSNAYRVLAGIYAKSDDAKARECFNESVKAQPLNYPAWREYAQYLQTKAATDPEAWKEYNRTLCSSLAPGWPEIAAHLLQSHAYAPMSKAMGEAALRTECIAFWEKLTDMGPARWDIVNMCDEQAKHLPSISKKPEQLCSFYADVLGAVAAKADYTPIVLSWGNKLAEKQPADIQKQFMAATVKGISKGEGLAAEDRDKIIAPAITAAEQMEDITTFQSLSKLLSPKFTAPAAKMPPHKPYPGKLMSQGGLVRTSSSSHESPCAHWGLLEPVGGHFHTKKEENPWVAVLLPKQAFVTGVVIIATSGNMQRLHNMKVQVSETGKDNDWQDVAQLGPCKQRVIQVDLGDKKPRAKYVRIVRTGGPDFFHLNAIYVYGEQAA